MAVRYTNVGAIEKYIMIDIDATQEAQVEEWIEAAEAYIDNYCNRPKGFVADAADTTRYYDGSNTTELDIDDFTSLTSVEVLEDQGDDVEYTLTEGPENDYIEFPYNRSPKYKLQMTKNSQLGVFLPGKKRIKITGKFGFATSVPKDIRLAATILAAKIVEKGQRGGDVAEERLGDYTLTLKDLNESAIELNVKQILDKYKIIEL